MLFPVSWLTDGGVRRSGGKHSLILCVWVFSWYSAFLPQIRNRLRSSLLFKWNFHFQIASCCVSNRLRSDWRSKRGSVNDKLSAPVWAMELGKVGSSTESVATVTSEEFELVQGSPQGSGGKPRLKVNPHHHGTTKTSLRVSRVFHDCWKRISWLSLYFRLPSFTFFSFIFHRCPGMGANSWRKPWRKCWTMMTTMRWRWRRAMWKRWRSTAPLRRPSASLLLQVSASDSIRLSQ